MSRQRKVEDADVFAALVRLMHRRGPSELTLRAIATEAGLTAGALVQRFGSKRGLMLAHARYAAATGDIGVIESKTALMSPLDELLATTEIYAQLASSPRAALRNLAYLQNDLTDPVLHRHLLRSSRSARSHYERLIAEAIVQKQLRVVSAPLLARLVEVTLRGSFLNWALYREGPAASWLRYDLENTLRPYLSDASQ